MKKHLLLAAIALLAISPMKAAIGESTGILVEQSNDNWKIYGCSQRNGSTAGADGGFKMMKDGNTNTFWHSEWNNNLEKGDNPGHFFIIDRGEGTENSTVAGFGYLPRQQSATQGCNGSVTSYSVYVVDNIDGINYVSNQTPTNEAATDGHSSLATFLTGKTANASGNWDIVHNDISTQGLRQVKFDEPAVGRYVIFKINSVSSSSANKHANCAEFHLYDYNASAYETEMLFKRNAEDSNPLSVTQALPSNSAWPEYPGFTCANTNPVGADNYRAEYILKEGEEIRIYNERKGTYIRTNNDNSHLEQVKNDNPGDRTIFRMIPMGTDGGFALYNTTYDRFVDNNKNSDVTKGSYSLAQFTNEPVKFYTGKQNAPNDYMCWIGTSPDKSGNRYFNDLEGSGVCSFSWNDAGSKWVIVTNLQQFKDNYALRAQLQAAVPNYLSSLELLGEEDTDNLKGWAEQYNFGGDVNLPVTEEAQIKINRILNTTTHANIIKAKQGGDKIIELGLITDAGIEAWNTAKESITGTDQAASDQLSQALEALGRATKTKSFKLQSGKPNCAVDYIGSYTQTYGNEPRRYNGDENSRIWTLQSAPNGGFYLYNEYVDRYIKHPNTSVPNQGNAIFVKDKSQASTYMIDAYETADELTACYFGLKTLDENVNADKKYLFSNSNNNIQGGVAGNTASWHFHAVNEADAANNHLDGAKAFYAAYHGDNIGQYNSEDQDALTTAYETTTEASIDAKRQAADVLFGMTLNMPKIGHFYRFNGVGNNNLKYLGTTISGNKLQMSDSNRKNDGEVTHEDQTDNSASTVYYYDGTHLITFADGRVFKRNGSNVNLDITDALGIEFHESMGLGHYFIVGNDAQGNNVRWYYNANTNVDSGDGNARYLFDAGYHWNISEVNWLPIPGSSSNGWTTFQAPIEVNTREGVTAYSLTQKGDNIVISEIASGDNGVIPANTPVALHCNNAQQDDVTGLVYLSPNYSDAQPVGESHLAKAKTDGVNYITLSGEQFVALTDANIPGFKAILEALEAKTYAMVDETVNNILTAVEGKVYTINCDGRGILTVNNEDETLEVRGNATGDNTLWTIVNHDGNTYLFNLGTQKFAAAYVAQPEGARPTAKKAEFRWHVDNYPTAVTIDWDEYDATVFATNAKFTILGGQNTLNSERPAGMMGIDNKVPCISGVNAQDGNGFVFTEVAGATIPDALTEKIAEAKAEMAAEHDAFVELLATDETAAQEVGYFDATTLAAYMSSFTAADADADAETKYYALMRAKNSIATPAYNEFAHSGKYNLMNENGQYYRAAAEKTGETSYETFAELADIDTKDLSFNWLASVNEDGTVTLTHTFQAPIGSTATPRNAMHRAPAGFKDFPVNFVENATPEYDGHGNITLPYAGETVTLRTATLPSDAQTTAIREVEAAGEGNAEAIYDLQGRRLNRALRGINIINGKKVLVK